MRLQQARGSGRQLSRPVRRRVPDQPAQTDPEPARTREGTVRPVQGNPHQGIFT